MTTVVSEETKGHLRTWCERLESGDYPQATGTLNKVGVGYCCLGVLTDQLKDVVGLEEHTDYMEQRHEDGTEFQQPIVAYRPKGALNNGETAVLPRQVSDFLGLPHTTVFVTTEDGYMSVVQLNDGKKLSFKEIAALVREEYAL
jgi:hypothetical protein